MNANDTNPTPKVKVELFVYEGDIVRDEDGKIINKLQQVIEHTSPLEETEVK